MPATRKFHTAVILSVWFGRRLPIPGCDTADQAWGAIADLTCHLRGRERQPGISRDDILGTPAERQAWLLPQFNWLRYLREPPTNGRALRQYMDDVAELYGAEHEVVGAS